jgi:hypothetical protein
LLHRAQQPRPTPQTHNSARERSLPTATDPVVANQPLTSPHPILVIGLGIGLGLVLVSVLPLAVTSRSRSGWVEQCLVVASGTGLAIALIAFTGLLVVA